MTLTSSIRYKRLFGFIMIAAVWMGLAQTSKAQETDAARLSLSYLQKLESPVKFTVQYHASESARYALKDIDAYPSHGGILFENSKGKSTSFKKLRHSLDNPIKCDYDKVLEVRYISPTSLACGVVAPIEDQEIAYSKLTSPALLAGFANGLKGRSWLQVDKHEDADVGILVELEITNVVNVYLEGLRYRLSNARINPVPRYVLGLRVTGVNMDPSADDKIVFQSVLMESFIEPPSEETLLSLMNSVGDKVGKQKTFGRKNSQYIRFDNYEEVDKK